MEKRGLSGVITALILVVLVFTAAVIVWIVIKNVITEQTDELTTVDIRLNLEVKSLVDNGDNVSVRVKRNVGEGEVSGLIFVISDGVNTDTIKIENPNLDKFEEKIYDLNYAGLVKEISVAPIFLTESGNEKKGREGPKKVYGGEEVVENIDGLVSWWRMDGGANDDVGGNHGTVNGGVEFIEDSGRGEVASFDGSTGNISCGVGITQNGPATIAGWFKMIDHDASRYLHSAIFLSSGNELYIRATGNTRWNLFPDMNEWYSFILTYDGNTPTAKLYVNGQERPQAQLDDNFIPEFNNFYIGINHESGQSFYGSIDEVMLFDRVLSEEEIEALYNLDLS